MKKYLYYLKSIFSLITGIREWFLVIRIFLRLPVKGTPMVTLRKTGVRFQVRGAKDIWSIKETFLDEFYRRYGTEIGDGWSIIDIGAGIGEFPLYTLQGHPTNIVYAFEPFPESFDFLQTNVKLNNAPSIKGYREAIGAESGTLTLNLMGDPLQISTEIKSSSQETVTVPSLSLKDAFQSLRLHHCNLLKLDCEGAEYPILFNAPAAVFDSIDNIVMEYHDGVQAHDHHQLAEFLESKGFSVKTYRNFVHAQLGYLYAFKEAHLQSL